MFSSRLPEGVEPSKLARTLADFRATGAPFLDLTESNPTRAGLVYPEREILAGFGDPRALVYDPEPFGLPQAREQIAELYGVSADRVILTASTSEAYSWLLKLLCDPGDEILVPTPSYPLFELLAKLESVTVRTYPLRYFRGWFVDTHAFEQAVSDRTRAVVVVNPNNPTGSFFKSHEQQEIAGICARRGLALISDEVFQDYPFEEDAERAGSVTKLRGHGLICSLNGLSKFVGLPQMKLGWMVVTGPPRLRRLALERLELIADTYLSVGTPAQYALPALLTARGTVQRQIRDRTRANRAFLKEAVAGSAASMLDVEGGWCATLRVPQTRTEDDWVGGLLWERGVLVQPGYFYDFDGEAFLVLSLLAEPDLFREGVGRIVPYLDAKV